jgi:hypothetical protein
MWQDRKMGGREVAASGALDDDGDVAGYRC